MSLETRKRARRPGIASAGIALLAGLTLCVPAGLAAPQVTRATTITVSAGLPSEFGFKLSKTTFPHGVVTFKVTNKGSVPHDFKVCASAKGGKANTCKGTGTKLIAPKATATLKYTFKTKGTYEYLCTVPTHASLGMKGTVKVT